MVKQAPLGLHNSKSMQRISNNLCRMFPREFEYSFYKKVYCNSTAIIKDGLNHECSSKWKNFNI